jgi:signal transduction histidine kinase
VTLRKLSLMQKFVVLSLAAIIPTGVALGFILARQIESRALEEARQGTSLLANSVIAPLVTPEDLGGLSPERLAELDRLIEERVVPHDVAQVKLWNPGGRVVYSNFPELVGKRFGVSHHLEEALQGQVISHVSHLQDAEHAELRELGEALEVYVPLRLSGRIVGAFEIYRPYRPIQAGIRADQRRLYAALAGGLLFLFVILGRVVRRASGALVRQADELADLYARERETVARLKEVDELKSDIVATVTHELRTPVTSMRGSLETLLSRGAALQPGEWEELVRIANRGAQRMQALIDELLEVPRLYSGERHLSIERVQLEPLIAELTDGLDGRVETELTPAADEVSTDRAAVRQILALLIDNALKFSPPTSPITVRTTAAGDEIHIAVEDQGPGVPAGEEERIFEPFYQADQSSTRQKGGVGLGLHLASKMAAMVGGRLALDRTREKGAAFVLSLPSGTSQQLAAG